MRFRGWRRMSKQEKKNLVPELRFPEFHNVGDWKIRPIGKVFSEKARPIDMVDEADYSLVTVKRRYGGVVSRGIFKGGEIKVKSQFKLKENDFLISKRQIVHCACGLVPKDLENSIVSNEYSVLKPAEGYDINFLNYFSQQPSVSQSFLKCSIGIVIEKMLFKLNDWFKQEFLFPGENEQQKIADCLFSIDELITAHTQKLEALKAHKKGLMQQLFPAEGETVPKLRFTEFREAEGWIEEKFGNITDFASGGTPSMNQKEYWGGDIPWISAASMHHIEIINSDKNITQLAVDDGARLALEGTLLLLVRGSMLHKRIPIGITKCAVAFNQDVKALKLKKNVIIKFLLYLLIASEKRLLGAVSKTGIGAGKLDTNDLKDFLVCIPRNTEEQQIIVESLSSIDLQISSQTQKIESLKSHKKGLMQQLFPSVGEVGV